VGFGISDEFGMFLVQHHLRWLGHLARMSDDHLPKWLLFREFLTTRPFHGPKLHWRDMVLRDIQRMGLDDLCQAISSGDLWLLVLLSEVVGEPFIVLETLPPL